MPSATDCPSVSSTSHPRNPFFWQTLTKGTLNRVGSWPLKSVQPSTARPPRRQLRAFEKLLKPLEDFCSQRT